MKIKTSRQNRNLRELLDRSDEGTPSKNRERPFCRSDRNSAWMKLINEPRQGVWLRIVERFTCSRSSLFAERTLSLCSSFPNIEISLIDRWDDSKFAARIRVSRLRLHVQQVTLGYTGNHSENVFPPLFFVSLLSFSLSLFSLSR